MDDSLAGDNYPGLAVVAYELTPGATVYEGRRWLRSGCKALATFFHAWESTTHRPIIICLRMDERGSGE